VEAAKQARPILHNAGLAVVQVLRDATDHFGDKTKDNAVGKAKLLMGEYRIISEKIFSK
jgi:hypothetical protein